MILAQFCINTATFSQMPRTNHNEKYQRLYEIKNMLIKAFLLVKMARLYGQCDEFIPGPKFLELFLLQLLDNRLTTFNCNMPQQTAYLKK
jgi:hypothetical protein